jgi:glutamate-1-semialdehyde 2,1-aminomutase
VSARRLAEGFQKGAVDAGVPTYHARVGSMLCTFFHDGEVVDYESAKRCDTQRYASYFHGMLEKGVYFAPSQFEASFVSTAHGEEDIDATIQASGEVMKSLK